MSHTIAVTQNPDKPVPMEILADAIVGISKAMKDLTEKGRLTREAIVILVQARTKLGMGTIGMVLDSVGDLEKNFIKKK